MAYVYGIVVDGVIRYIGKGSGKGYHGTRSRFLDHMRAMRRLIRRCAEGLPPTYDCQGVISRPLAHAYLDGAVIECVVLADKISDRAARWYENEEIEASPKGQLWNKGTSAEIAAIGGRASGGMPKTKRTRERIAAALKGKPKSEAHKAALRKPKRRANVIEFPAKEAV